MIEYKVHLFEGHSVTIHAEKLHPGTQRLWFYDGDDNLVALFLWKNIQGFSVVGSATGQITVDELLHQRKWPTKPTPSASTSPASVPPAVAESV